MPPLHAINRTLLTLLDNQTARTEAALEGLTDEAIAAEPGSDCNSILGIGRHLLLLRRFQMSMLEAEDLAGRVDDPDACRTLEQLHRGLDAAADLLRKAITEHDPEDWYRTPSTPRAGKWGEDPTLLRFVRPFTDFTNHLGAIRAIRRIAGQPAERTM